MQVFAAVGAPCALAAALRVLGSSARGSDGLDVTLAVSLTRSADEVAVAAFELELRLQRRVAA